MTKKIFLSYSRREMGFVDDLVSQLEAQNHPVWLDYRALIPGKPWDEQIETGLREAELVLLVVSKASLASQYVELEWRHFLDNQKRLILLIFEAVDLPAELEKYEWVDFRGNYQAGLKELFAQLEQPAPEAQPVPETGFKAPSLVWGAMALSGLVALISLGAFWTLFIPFFLVPLPYQIYKRSFDFMQVQAALAALPLAISLAALIYIDPQLSLEEGLGLGFAFGIWGWLLLVILRQPSLQRWGKPEATPPTFANLYRPKVDQVQAVPFYIDHAPDDRAIAEDLTATLKKYGHPQANHLTDARAVFALISKFKTETEADPERQIVFPVLLQSTDDIAPKLSKIQWIDFRPGVRGVEIIAKLLPEPSAMLKALGIRPVSSQSVYPPMVTTLYFFTVLMTTIFLGATLDYLFLADMQTTLEPSLYSEVAATMLGGLTLFAGLTYLMVQSLFKRRGSFANLPMLLAGLATQGGLIFGLFKLEEYIYDLAAEFDLSLGLNFAYFGPLVYGLGLALLFIIFWRNPKDLRLWLPAKQR